jgi:enoyl-CoA hydratase/carnithine racemase
MEFFQLNSEGVTAEVVIDRPNVLNSANTQWIGEFLSVLDAGEAMAGLRVVVISGAGRSFCTGIDLNALAQSLASPEHKIAMEAYLRDKAERGRKR